MSTIRAADEHLVGAQWMPLTDALRLTRLSQSTIRRRAASGQFKVDRTVTPHLYAIPDEVLTTPSGGHQDVGRSVVRDHRGAHGEFDDAGSAPTTGGHEVLMVAADLQVDHRIMRLEEDKAHLRDELTQREVDHKARVGALEKTVAVREARVSELTDQVSALESKVREILENGQTEALGLANRIADLVERQHDAEVRIYELQPVAERVPMLEAAVDETKTRLHETEGDLVERDKKLSERERQLADISQDIETIASRPVAGPVFRLLTKGKLRI